MIAGSDLREVFSTNASVVRGRSANVVDGLLAIANAINGLSISVSGAGDRLAESVALLAESAGHLANVQPERPEQST